MVPYFCVLFRHFMAFIELLRRLWGIWGPCFSCLWYVRTPMLVVPSSLCSNVTKSETNSPPSRLKTTPPQQHYTTIYSSLMYSLNAVEWKSTLLGVIWGITSFGVEIHSQNRRIHSKAFGLNHSFESGFPLQTKWSLIWLLKECFSTPVHLESRQSLVYYPPPPRHETLDLGVVLPLTILA